MIIAKKNLSFFLNFKAIKSDGWFVDSLLQWFIFHLFFVEVYN